MIKICPNCGSTVDASAKFCTSCGNNLSEITATEANLKGKEKVESEPIEAVESTVNDQQKTAIQSSDNAQENPKVDATKEYARGYWSYLLDSVKHPFAIKKKFHSYFGLTSLLIMALFSALAVFMTVRNAVTGLTGIVDNFTGANTSQNNLGFGSFLGILLMLVAFNIITATVSYVVTYGFLGDKRNNYLSSLNDFAHFCNFSVFTSGAACLFSFIHGTTGVVTFLLIVTMLFLNTAFIAAVFHAQATTNFDRIYAYLLGTIILTVTYLILFAIFGSVLTESIGQMISNFRY